MTHVKWLRSITAVTEPFDGWQQTAHRRTRSTKGEPVTRMLPRSLLVPPGIPDFLTRERTVERGPDDDRGPRLVGLRRDHARRVQRRRRRDLGGRASSTSRVGRYAWVGWRFDWDAAPGAHELCARATDAAGNVQPLDANVEPRRLLQQQRAARAVSVR